MEQNLEMWRLPVDAVTKLPRGYDDWPAEKQTEYIFQLATMQPPGWQPPQLPPVTD